MAAMLHLFHGLWCWGRRGDLDHGHNAGARHSHRRLLQGVARAPRADGLAPQVCYHWVFLPHTGLPAIKHMRQSLCMVKTSLKVRRSSEWMRLRSPE